MLLRESALKEDPDLESIRATIAGSDEVKTFLCAVIAAWCSLVLMCTAKNVNSTGVLELELIKARRASRQKNASEFADIMGDCILQCSEMESLMDGLEAEVDTPCYCEEDVHGDDAFNDEKFAAVAVAEVLVSAAADTMSANSEANRAFITN